jgi:hypothetical protein
MKKNALTTAVVAGVAGVAGLANVATAVNLNPDGLGQVLIYPYYTVNEGQATLVSIVNTTNQAKAVKVRFVEALNSAEVLDFNLYLSRFDVWTAALTQDTDGTPILTTEDRSCTVPDVFAAQPVAFRPFEFQENNFDINGLIDGVRVGGSGGSLVELTPEERMSQGYLEVIEMGVLFDEGTTSASFRPATWATHGSSGVPSNCAGLVSAWDSSGTWQSIDPSNEVGPRGVNSPTGGLFGSGVIVDVDFGRALTYNAVAIDGFWRNTGLAVAAATAGGEADLHFRPGSTFPSLEFARTEADDTATANIFANGSVVSLNYNAGLNAVSAVLMSEGIFNEFNIEQGFLGASEWVVTFPTKRAHTYFPATLAGQAQRPFTDAADSEASSSLRDGLLFDTYGICETINTLFFDREERTRAPTGSDFSPPRPGQARDALCWEANVVAFNQTVTADGPTAVLGTAGKQGAQGINVGTFTSGWVRMDFNANSRNPATGLYDLYSNFLVSNVNAVTNRATAMVGLPVVGFWAADYQNTAAAAGVRANYSQLHDHRYFRNGFQLLAGAAVPAYPNSLPVVVGGVRLAGADGSCPQGQTCS